MACCFQNACKCVQKLVSNMVIRARPSLALASLSATDAVLYAPASPQATITASGQVPPLAELDTSHRLIVAGALLPRPVLFIPSDRITDAMAQSLDAGATLLDLASLLQQGGDLYGALMPAGSEDLTRLLPQRYVQQRMLYESAVRKRIDACHAASDRDADTITALLQARLITRFDVDTYFFLHLCHACHPLLA